MKATKARNQDVRPGAVFHMQRLWFKQEAGGSGNMRGHRVPLRATFFILLFAGAMFALFKFRRDEHRLLKGSLYYAAFSSGFWAMLMNLVILFLFQISRGYLYYKIGVLLSVFMAGAALASLAAGAFKNIRSRALEYLAVCEGVMVLFTGALAGGLSFVSAGVSFSDAFFYGLVFLCGGLNGLEFPLFIEGWQKLSEGKGGVSFYGLDLIGGGSAGILGPFVLMPLLGFYTTLLVLIALKILSCFLLSVAAKAHPPMNSEGARSVENL